MDTSIFGLRFKSNEALQPGAADLSAFLQSPRVPGLPGTHQDDLAVFQRYCAIVEQFEAMRYQSLGGQDMGERMLLSVLSHTRFFRPALRIAVEEYKYYHHQLLQLDLAKPETFIRSAESEMARLSPKKEDQHKIARLQELIDQRKNDLEALIHGRRMLTGELCHIAVYVLDNMVMVRQLCEDAVTRLARLEAGGEKTGQLIEDLKALFKDEVRDYRQMGKVTPEYLESVKAEVAQLSQLLAQQVHEDIVAMNGIYEGLRGHAEKNTALLGELIARAEKVRKNDASRDIGPFTDLECALIALISDFQPDIKIPEQIGAGVRHEDLLRDKRREMLEHIFVMLREQRKDSTWTT
jgi:hypothetical protein